MKKGNISWKPAGITDTLQKEPGYRYRWCNKDSDNLAKKTAEGWEPVSALQADKTTPVKNDKFNPLTSTHERRDAILCRLPEELAEARDEYHNQRTARTEEALSAHIKQELAKDGVKSHGKITISSRQGTKTME